jgi:hypothetical protein
MLAQFLSGVELRFEGWNVPGLLGFLGFAVLVACLFWNGSSREDSSPARKRAAARRGPGQKLLPREQLAPYLAAAVRILQAPPSPEAAAEQRDTLRREGNPVDVLVSDAEVLAEPAPGVVLNRSRGGLLLSLTAPAEVGAVLTVRAAHAVEQMDWVPVEVRHCRQKGDRWLAGCKFGKELPWSVLLLFG